MEMLLTEQGGINAIGTTCCRPTLSPITQFRLGWWAGRWHDYNPSGSNWQRTPALITLSQDGWRICLGGGKA